MKDHFREFLESIKDTVNAQFIPNLNDFFAERSPLVWMLALAIGLSVGCAVLAFRTLIGLVQYPWLFDTSENVASAARQVPFWIVLLTPAIGGLLVGYLLERFVPGRRAHGPADVIEASHMQDVKIDAKTGLWSAGLSVISLGTGSSAGREGPMVHLGATLAAMIDNFFSLKRGARRTLLACGAAAAVSASFNAPVAGVLFAHEVILAHYAIRSLVPIVISSVTAAVISRLYYGEYPAFIIPQYSFQTYWEFPAFALLGVVCAIVAVLFQLSLVMTERFTWRFDLPLWVRGGIGGLLVGLIALVFPEVLGVGYEPINEALSQNLPLSVLLALIVVKTIATSISLATRAAGGVFSPSLYLGAMTGAAFGIIAASAMPQIGASQGPYTLLGMGGVAAAVLGAPMSTVMIVFELTGGYHMTIALLLTVSISIALSYALVGHSYFHWQLRKRGILLHHGPHRSIMRRMRVLNFMTPLEKSNPKDDDGSQGDGTGVDGTGAEDPIIISPDQPTLLINDTLETALKLFSETGEDKIAIVANADKNLLIGWALRFDAINAFNQAMISENIEEHR
ncbi:MAG: chloride channel protein [Hyphomicrobiaceae bacterium]